MREIGQKEAGESAGLCMEIMVSGFHHEERCGRPGPVEDGEMLLS